MRPLNVSSGCGSNALNAHEEHFTDGFTDSQPTRPDSRLSVLWLHLHETGSVSGVQRSHPVWVLLHERIVNQC